MSLTATDYTTAKHKKHKNKRKLTDSGLESEEVSIKYKKQKTTSSEAQRQFSDSVLSNNEDEIYKRKHKNKKYKK